MPKKKWENFSEEEIREFYANSTSLTEVYTKMGYKGGSASRLTKDLAIKLNINISHFTGQSHTKNLGSIRTSTEKYLDNSIKITSHKLRLRLISEGILEEKCNCCGLTEWLGKSIPLELHHKDGNKNNNNLENLELVCPNCHTLTNTYKSKNRK